MDRLKVEIKSTERELLKVKDMFLQELNVEQQLTIKIQDLVYRLDCVRKQSEEKTDRLQQLQNEHFHCLDKMRALETRLAEKDEEARVPPPCRRCERFTILAKQNKQLSSEVWQLRMLNKQLAEQNRDYATRLEQMLRVFKQINTGTVQREEDNLTLQLSYEQLLRKRQEQAETIEGLRAELSSNVEVARFFREKASVEQQRCREEDAEFGKVVGLFKTKALIYESMEHELTLTKQIQKHLECANEQLVQTNHELREICLAFEESNHKLQAELRGGRGRVR